MYGHVARYVTRTRIGSLWCGARHYTVRDITGGSRCSPPAWRSSRVLLSGCERSFTAVQHKNSKIIAWSGLCILLLPCTLWIWRNETWSARLPTIVRRCNSIDVNTSGSAFRIWFLPHRLFLITPDWPFRRNRFARARSEDLFSSWSTVISPIREDVFLRRQASRETIGDSSDTMDHLIDRPTRCAFSVFRRPLIVRNASHCRAR